MATNIINKKLVGFVIFAAVSLSKALGQSAEPTYVEVLPGGSQTFLCQSTRPLQYCRFVIPSLEPVNLSPNLDDEGVVYFGHGLDKGQCGVKIKVVSDRMNGLVNCTMGIVGDSKEMAFSMRLLVLHKPKTPILELLPGSQGISGIYKTEENIRASCIVKDSRPVSNITWFIDTEPITEGLTTITEFHSLPNHSEGDLSSAHQNLTRRARPSDNGKKLRCVAVHPAIRDGSTLEMGNFLDIKYPPQPQQNPIHRFGFELNRAGIIAVEIEANPRPQFEWQIRSERLKEGDVDSTGRLEAEKARDEGRGRYIANLRLASINKEDTETQFKLTVYNDLGNAEYYVQISTEPEPEGVELGVGTIVGIVAAILILLCLVFVTVYARAQGRWCFSGRETRTGGGESDTESADATRRDNPFVSKTISLITLLRSHKTSPRPSDDDPEAVKDSKLDDVKLDDQSKKEGSKLDQAKISADPKLSVDPKLDPKSQTDSSLVYAQLDLANPASFKPLIKPADDKTEYAEIVYTNKPNDEET